MAKRKCVPCIGSRLKELIKGEAPDLAEYLDQVQECRSATEIQLCHLDGRRKRSGRPPSAYNTFISGCMKEGNVHGRHEAAARMKTCAAQWRSGSAPPSPSSGSVPAGAAVAGKGFYQGGSMKKKFA